MLYNTCEVLHIIFASIKYMYDKIVAHKEIHCTSFLNINIRLHNQKHALQQIYLHKNKYTSKY